jgi:hypothetical protein
MKYARSALFFTFLAVFVITAMLTFVGIMGIRPIPERYLNVLFSALIVEVVAAVVGLYRSTDWFGRQRTDSAVRLLEGGWWQMVRAGQTNAMSFIRIEYSGEEEQLVLTGESFSTEGARYASWWSIAASLNAASCELRYFWKGDHSKEDADFSGVGWVRFERRPGDQRASRGSGWFISGNLEESRIDARRKVEMVRATAEEVRGMDGANEQAKLQLVSTRYAAWRASPPAAALAGGSQ